MRVHARTLAALVLLAAQAASLQSFAEEKPLPTPVAAGTSPQSKPPPPVKEEPATSFTEDDLPSSAEAGDLPEPFFCQSALRKSADKDLAKMEWVNSGSDYPKEVPPFEPDVLVTPFSEQSGKISWGTCVESRVSKETARIELEMVLFTVHGASKPVVDSKKCTWTSQQKGKTHRERLNLKIGQWAGIEFDSPAGERLRYTAHWPSQTQPDTTGEFCKQFALAMNNKSFDVRGLRKMKLNK